MTKTQPPAIVAETQPPPTRMETIYEVDEQGHHGGPDPPGPFLLYVPSDKDSRFYVRSFKHPLTVLHVQYDPAKFDLSPDIYYPAWRPLPTGFFFSNPVNPLGVLVKLTQDGSLINHHCPPSTLPDQAGAAQKRVLESTEILENVFANVDAVTLLTSVQRVSKTWKRVVDGSVLLQRMLFFTPDKTHPLGPHPQARREKESDSGKLYPEVNSLLVRYFRSTLFSFGSHSYGYTRRSESFYEQRWTSKHNTLKLKSRLGYGPNKYLSIKPNMTRPEKLQASLDRDRFTRAGASWRRMLVSQPPISDFIAMEFSTKYFDHDRSGEKLDFGIVHADHPDKGLRMGQLYDFVQDRVGNHPLDQLWYRVIWFEPRGPFASNLSEDGCRIMFDDLKTKCVVEMFHCPDTTNRYSPTSSSSFLTSFVVREGPLSITRFHAPNFGSKHNPRDPAAFDAIFKCNEFVPVNWAVTQEVTDYCSTTRPALTQLDY